jgi:hypothetical protein
MYYRRRMDAGVLCIVSQDVYRYVGNTTSQRLNNHPHDGIGRELEVWYMEISN